VMRNDGFNIPPLVEAADTAPFFHNNASATLEEAVAFYNSPAFNNSPAALGLGGAINLNATQVL
jgi:cytochrome c peroxidase